eukprot:TRINITY_DN752_c0_g1_i5.p1 TRINITY_DN752_c0_g1~~TRINITY_DN752_c0_g1_i5.p1  ORF type:complete len:120 (+),score=10.82 TRINITY_DN752_c0_g1_i5:460-819(+)
MLLATCMMSRVAGSDGSLGRTPRMTVATWVVVVKEDKNESVERRQQRRRGQRVRTRVAAVVLVQTEAQGASPTLAVIHALAEGGFALGFSVCEVLRGCASADLQCATTTPPVLCVDTTA